MDFLGSQKLLPVAPSGFVKRSEFGKDFVFGSATAAFQIEGAAKKDGRGESIWDTFAKENDLFHPYHEDAVNHYDKFEEDVQLMKDIGFDAYRFSISWSRILPTGKKVSRNQAGIDFYKKLLCKLKEHNIKPFVTLFHFDLPQALQDEYNGFLDRRIVDDFGDYADICFQEFGLYVDHWITLNEPFTYAYSAHVDKVHAPGLGTVKDHLFGTGTNTANTTKVDDDEEEAGSIFHPSRSTVHKKSTREKVMIFRQTGSWFSRAKVVNEFEYPYLVTHNLLLAHAKAVQIYRNKYQAIQRGKIGITLVSMWFEPRNINDEKDKAAALRAVDFFLGWYLSPLVKGEYPDSMKEYVYKDHLPEMGADKETIKGSYDFIGLNYYTARYVSHQDSTHSHKHKKGSRNYITDQRLKYYETRKMEEMGGEVPISQVKGASEWLISYPRGIMELLLHVKENYNNPLIYITENGVDDLDDGSSRVWDSFCDQKRVTHIHDHLLFLSEAKRRGVKVKGYFVWSLLDNFEWNNGFHARFGLIYVDYNNGGKRYPKLSAAWLKDFLAN